MNTKAVTLLWLLGWMTTNPASAASGEWTTSWAQGVSMYTADDGNGNELLISCPDHDGYVSAQAVIQGKLHYSDDEQGFDVIVDGQLYDNPFFTDCHACSNSFKEAFWESLRQTNRLQLTAQGRTINLPTRNLQTVLPPLDDPENSCRSAW